jgi:hypothetical protein
MRIRDDAIYGKGNNGGITDTASTEQQKSEGDDTANKNSPMSKVELMKQNRNESAWVWVTAPNHYQVSTRIVITS